MTRPKYNSEQRTKAFWEKVNTSGGPDACWPWTGCLHKNGYGKFGIGDHHTDYTHRVAWRLAHGDIPDGLLVCHHCDNKICCNVKHLFLGTTADNIADKVQKHRTPCGETHHNHVLTDEIVREIRRLHAAGMKSHAIAVLYDTTGSQVCLIYKRKAWAHVSDVEGESS